MKRSISLVTAFVLLELCALGSKADSAFGQTPSPMSIRAAQLVLSDVAGHYLLINPPTGLTGNLVWSLPTPPAGNPQSGFIGVGTASGQMLYWDNTAGSQQWKQSSDIKWDNSSYTLSATNITATGALTANALTLTTALAPANGGTGIGSYTPGSMLYASNASTLTEVTPNATSTTKFLSQTNSGAPVWSDVAGSFIENNASATPQTASVNVTGNVTTGGALTATELRGAGTSAGSAGNDAKFTGNIPVSSASTTYTITNSKVTPTSAIILTYIESATPGHTPAGPIGAWVRNLASGTFDINLTAAPPAGSSVCYMIVNP